MYLVGAGPGDAGLITVRGKQLIESCDVLVYDFLASPQISQWAGPGCELVYVGKRPNRHTIAQDAIADILIEGAQAGKAVVRLKGGDPYIFGRGGEEAQRLHAAKIPFEVVPGVTAALAAGAYAGIPVTHRAHSSAVTFLTGHEDPNRQELRLDFRKHAAAGGTFCIYMGVGQSERICRELKEGGLPGATPACAVEWASLPNQRVVEATLESLPQAIQEAAVHSPAVLFVGEVCRLRAQMDWFVPQAPLRGKRIVVTRARSQAGRLSGKLSSLGAEVLELPLIETRPMHEPADVAQVLREIGTYRYLIFTSRNGVAHFFELFLKSLKDLRLLGPKRIACVGTGTAEALRKFHLEADLMPDASTSAALADALLEEGDIENEKVLLITGNLNKDALAKKLEGKGRALVDSLQVYETRLADLAHSGVATDFRQNGADAITFTSASTVKSFARQAQHLQLAEGARVPKAFSIGPQTSAAMKEAGLPCTGEASAHTLEGMTELLLAQLGA